MRTFIAIQLPQHVIQMQMRIISRLQEHNISNIKWVETENLHITLLFLGEVEQTNIQDIKDLLEHTFTDFSSPQFENPQLQIIPAHNPRLLWTAFDCPQNNMSYVYRKLKKELQKFGCRFDKKPLRLHSTLARFKSDPNPDFIQSVLNLKLPPLKFTPPAVTLYQSKLLPHGPCYIPLQEINFK